MNNHKKPNSLDFWLRTNYAKHPDTKQAANEVMTDLLNTGQFKIGEFSCRDSKGNKKCKGLELEEGKK